MGNGFDKEERQFIIKSGGKSSENDEIKGERNNLGVAFTERMRSIKRSVMISECI